MSTTDQVLLIVLTSLLSLFFILLIAVVIVVLKTISEIKKVIAKAEHVIGSVESATDVLRNVGVPLSALKVV